MDLLDPFSCQLHHIAFDRLKSHTPTSLPRNPRKPGDNCTQVTSHSSWKGGQIFARDHSFGISPVSINCWKRSANTGPNSVASSFRTLGWSSSGPKALEGFKPLRSLITPSLEITISFMKGADLSRSGTWVCSFLLNASVNWPLSSSAFSRSD